jgi:protease-4
MGKFLLGLVAGLLLALLVSVLGVFALARLGAQPPSIPSRGVLVLNLDGDVPERAGTSLPLSFFEERAPLTVDEVWRVLRRAETDTRIKAVVLKPVNLGIGWARLQELRGDVARLVKSGKPVLATLRSPSTRDYYIASAAGRVFMPPEDMLDLKGLRAELMFFRGTLDKLGVQVEIEHAGKYKDYGDMFTRAASRPETREVLNGVLDGVYGNLVEAVAAGRKKTPVEVRTIIDQGPFVARQALQHGLVDALLYEDQVFDEASKLGGGGTLVRVNARNYAREMVASETGGRNRVALVVGEGTISRGSAGSFSDGTGIQSDDFIKLLKQLEGDGTLRGAVVRINSPGGDAFASDEIWRAMNTFSKKKPLVVSMSDEAASGGYYMAMTGDPVVAYGTTYTGSIGVVYGKINLRGLYGKLGITKELMSRGRFAVIDSDYEPLNEAGRQKLREGVDETYRTFVQKVAEARKRKFEEIEPLAQGRVWLGEQAKQRGLVDDLGGLDRAFELLRQRARIPSGEKLSLSVYPRKRSLLDLLMSRSMESQGSPWLQAFLARWPSTVLAGGGYLRLMPYSIQVR